MIRLSRILVPAILALASAAAFGAEGYRSVGGTNAATESDTIEVTEFFWYGCPHCYRFRPHIARWSEDTPDDVTVRHVPTVFAPSWKIHGRAFYAAKAMGVLEQFHDAMFKAMHEEGRKLESEQAIGEFVSSLGIDGEEFVETMGSFGVDSRMRRARELQKTYGIQGTPSVVIDGRFVTSGKAAGSFERMIEVIDERVAALRGETD